MESDVMFDAWRSVNAILCSKGNERRKFLCPGIEPRAMLVKSEKLKYIKMRKRVEHIIVVLGGEPGHGWELPHQMSAQVPGYLFAPPA